MSGGFEPTLDPSRGPRRPWPIRLFPPGWHFPFISPKSRCCCELQFDVRDFGASADPSKPGVASQNSIALRTAIATVPHGATLCFPAGHYLIDESLTIPWNKRINLAGDGGRGNIQVLSPKPLTDSVSAIVADAALVGPAVVFEGPPDPVPNQATLSRFSAIRNLDILGFIDIDHATEAEFTHYKDQHGIDVANVGIVLDNVMIAFFGGNGLHITNSMEGSYCNVRSGYNAGAGLYTVYGHGNVLGLPEGGGIAVTNNVFINFFAEGNRRAGINIHAGWGNVFIGGGSEGNGGFTGQLDYGVRLGGGSSAGAQGNRFFGFWDEQNGEQPRTSASPPATLLFEGGDWHDGGSGANHNFIDFARWASGGIVEEIPPALPPGSEPQHHSNAWQGVDYTGPRTGVPFVSRLQVVNAVLHGHTNGGFDVGDPHIDVHPAAAGSGSVGAAAGAGDQGGTIQITTGTGTASGALATITFRRRYATSPVVIVTPANATAAAEALHVYIPPPGEPNGPTRTQVSLYAARALTAHTSYTWSWFVLETPTAASISVFAVDTVPAGAVAQIDASLTYSDATVEAATAELTWSSSNTGIAVVSDAAGSKGQLQAIAQGTVTISATDPVSRLTASREIKIT